VKQLSPDIITIC